MPPRGSKMSREARMKIAAANRGRTHSEETKAKIGAGNRGKLKGRPISDEHKAKIAAAMKGRTHSEETKAKLRKPRSEETKARMRVARNARPLAEWVTYEAAHYRIRGELGSAREHECIGCGKPANEWALQHESVGEIFKSPEGKPYSLNAEDYKPMCHSCHIRMDKNRNVV